MKIKNAVIKWLFLSACGYSAIAMACKLTPLASSAQKMTAVLNYITQHSEQQSEIISIRQHSELSSHYIVKTTANGSDDQRKMYEVQIQPDCAVTVQTVK